VFSYGPGMAAALEFTVAMRTDAARVAPAFLPVQPAVIHARRLRVAFGSFVGMNSRALGWAYLQINKTFANGRL
jgi:hypothetical protein